MKTNPIPQPWYAQILALIFPIRPFEVSRNDIFTSDSTINKHKMGLGEVLRAFN